MLADVKLRKNLFLVSFNLSTIQSVRTKIKGNRIAILNRLHFLFLHL